MEKRTVATCLCVISLLSLAAVAAFAAETGETARLVTKITPSLIEMEKGPAAKDRYFVDFFYEPSDIVQGNRTGHWNEFTWNYGYIHQNITGYFAISRLERFDVENYTANFGSYWTFKDFYVHGEVGFGWDVEYIYKMQSIVEYAHKITDGLFWQIGYNYRAYAAGDTHLVYPGLIYYFGNSYISADWGFSAIESRDTAQYGTFKGDFAITDFLNLSGGIAVGQRLYDIYALSAAKERGFILFSTLTIKIYKDMRFRIGYSYSEEAPKFIKRSINFGANVKF